MGPKRLDAGELFREYEGFVTSFLLRNGTPPEEVPDLVQEVFLVAHRKGGFEHAEHKPTTWLAAVALRVASDQRRKRARKRSRESFDLEAIARAFDPNASPPDAAAAKERLNRVRRALRTIPGGKRAVFVMYELEGRTCVEIGQVLRIPVGTVYSRLHGAREQFLENYVANEGSLANCNSVSFVSLGVRAIIGDHQESQTDPPRSDES